MMRPVGWRYESHRHALAARGVRTTYLVAKPMPKEKHLFVSYPSGSSVLPTMELVDDGTMDTVVSVDGKRIRYNPEFGSQFRDKTGKITSGGWERLKEQALKDYDDMFMAKKGYYALDDNLEWFRDLSNTKRVTGEYMKSPEEFGEEQEAWLAYASPTEEFMKSAFFARKRPWEVLVR